MCGAVERGGKSARPAGDASRAYASPTIAYAPGVPAAHARAAWERRSSAVRAPAERRGRRGPKLERVPSRRYLEARTSAAPARVMSQTVDARLPLSFLEAVRSVDAPDDL